MQSNPPTDFHDREEGDYGLTPMTLAMHLVNMLLNKALVANPQQRCQSLADARDEIARLYGSDAAPTTGHNPFSVLYAFLRHDGILGLAKGVVADLLFSIPCFANETLGHIAANTVVQSLEDVVSSRTEGTGGHELLGFAFLVAGRVIPSLIASLAVAPRDTVLTNLHCTTSNTLTSSAESVKSDSAAAVPPTAGASAFGTIRGIWARNGVCGFYQGWWLAPLGAAVKAIGYFGTYYAAVWLRPMPEGSYPSLRWEWGVGAAAAIVGTLAGQPFNVLRSRMMLAAGVGKKTAATSSGEVAKVTAGEGQQEEKETSSAAAAGKYSSVAECYNTLMATNGVLGLWQGTGVALAFSGIGTAINFFLSDI